MCVIQEMSLTCDGRVFAFVNCRRRCENVSIHQSTEIPPVDVSPAHILMICGECVALGGLAGNSLCNVQLKTNFFLPVLWP